MFNSTRWAGILSLSVLVACGGGIAPSDAATLDARDIVDGGIGDPIDLVTDSMLACPPDPLTLIGSACTQTGRVCGFCSEWACTCDAAWCNGTTWERVTSWPHSCDAIDITDAVVDAPDGGPTTCDLRGGTCVPGIRSSIPPGFRVTCPGGATLNDGQQMALGGGVNIHDMYGDGCGYLSSGGESAPQACCYPVRDASADGATADAAATHGDAGAGSECTMSSECADGLLCCYPCGIPGCTNRCTAVAPGESCPLLP